MRDLLTLPPPAGAGRRSRHLSISALGLAAAVLVLLTSAAPAKSPAKPVAPPRPALSDPLRTDPQVRTGKLANGLTWYVRHNARPEHRVSLRLAVQAGSNLEEDDQQGLAHFVEHMNFNGSAHFKPDQLVEYLQSIGLRFGADANAYTSFDETVYSLDVPTDRDTLLDRGLDALSDFAGRATMTEEEITKERGVVMEEWRLGRGADDRLLRKQFPVLFRGSRYADRLPIGKPEVIQGAASQRLRDFYRKWYTPDQMAVIAVGDIEPERMERLIREHFSDLARPAAPRPRPVFAMPHHQETLISIAGDREATGTSVSVYYKQAREPHRTVRDYRRDLVESLYDAMLNSRLDEIAHGSSAPFLDAGAGASELGRTSEAWVVGVDAEEGGAEKALAGALEEVARVRQHGFLASELDREKREFRAQIERAYAERDKSESSGHAARLVESFLSNEPATGIEDRFRYSRAFLDGITLAEVNALTARLTHDGDRVVLVSAPEKQGATLPTESAIRAVLDRSARTPTTAWVDKTSEHGLTAPEKPGTIASRREIAELGVTVLTLSNGVEVWLKPTDFKADEIVFNAYSLGGLSLADSNGFTAAWMSPTAASAMGLGGFKDVELQKLAAGHIVNAPVYMGHYTHGINGSMRPADLETELQLVRLTFMGPTRDPDAFAALKKQFHTYLTDRANSPEEAFEDTVNAVNSGHFYMQEIPSAADVDSMRLAPVADFFAERYRNAADFTFFFAGSFQVDSVAPLIARYLGGLPSTGKRTAAYVTRGPRFPRGVKTVRVLRGVEPKSTTHITFFTNDGLDELDLHRGRACATILTDHLRERLRELLGGTYSASASFGYLLPIPGYSTMTIAFGCAPENTDKMVAAALDEVKKLREQGPTAEDVQRDQEIERRELEVSVRQNGYWTGSLQTVHQLGWDPLRIIRRRERIDGLNRENLRDTFRKYFPIDRYTVISLLPEKTAPDSSGAGGRPGR